MFVFREIGVLWSSSRIKFTNLRFEDFHFFPIFVSILETVFVRPKIVRTNIFFLGKKKLKVAQNVRELAQIFG